jgi:hypothetical protein
MPGTLEEKREWLGQVGVTAFDEAPGGVSASGRGAAVAAPTKAKDHELTTGERLDEMLKTQVVLAAASALHQQYQTLATHINQWKGHKDGEIEALKPHQTPKGAGLVTAIAKTIDSVAHLAFPELLIIEVTGVGIETAEKVITILEDDETKKAEEEATAAKAAAKGQLADLLADVETAQQNAASRLEDLVDKALRNDTSTLQELGRLKLDQSQYSKIREVLATKFKIKRGTDADPSVFQKMVAELDKKFKKWLMSSYQERHLSKLVKDHAGSDKQIGGTLVKLYLIYTSDDPDKDAKLDKAINDAEAWYIKTYEMGGKWGFRMVLDEIIKKQSDGYADVFEGSPLDARKSMPEVMEEAMKRARGA